MRNQTSFRLTTTLLPTDMTAKTTTVINKVDSNGDKFYPTFTEETVVLTNDDRTVMETTRAICTDWVLTFVKRGLSDDNTATEITNRKLTWNPWTLAFITAGASDMIDVDDDLIWTGNQTYTGSATYQWMLTTAKWVKYPSFANVAALNAYANPYGWMFATVDDTWELYRYNAVTEQWDLVSTVELSQYIFRESDTPPEAWTADNIVTLSPEMKNIYLWTKETTLKNYYIDALVVWWGGGGNWNNWWGGWVVKERFSLPFGNNINVVNVSVWEWGNWSNGCPSSICGKWVTLLSALWGGAWWCLGWNGWGDNCAIEWNSGWHQRTYTNRDAWWWGWSSGWQWCDGSWIASWNVSSYWWNGWIWWYSQIMESFYWWGWGWAWYSSQGTWWAGGWNGGCNATWYWWGWGGCCGWTTCWYKWVVVIRYPENWCYWFTCATGWSVSCSWWYKIHTFTDDWTFCIIN